MREISVPPSDLMILHAILAIHLPAEVQVWVFGSRATGHVKRSCDLDLAIDAGRPLTSQESIG